MKPTLFLMLILVLGMLSCQSEKEDTSSETEKGFIIKHGINASHWLSQSEKRGEAREEYMQATDFKKIAAMGFDHVRLPIDEMHLWDEKGNKIDTAFQLMHKAVQWSFENKLRVIVDLHVLRSHHFNEDSRKLWTDTLAQQNFLNFWKKLSSELIRYSTDSLAYEPLNEAVAENPEDWNNLVAKAIETIRKNEPVRTIVVGSNRWQTVENFQYLKVPENDSNIILSFHFYDPFLISHYKAPWTGVLKDYTSPVNYPGYAIDTNEYINLDAELVNKIKEQNYDCNIETMEAKILMAVKVANELKLPLYCGEYGFFPTTPIEMRKQIYSDLTKIFNKHNIARAHWNYKNDFPLVDGKTLEPINELVSVIVNDSLVKQTTE